MVKCLPNEGGLLHVAGLNANRLRERSRLVGIAGGRPAGGHDFVSLRLEMDAVMVSFSNVYT